MNARRSFLLLVLFIFAIPAQAQSHFRSARRPSPYQLGRQAGAQRADTASLPEWYVGSFLSGATGSIVGAGLAYGLADKKRSEEVWQWEPAIVERHGEDYWQGFDVGYRARMNSKRKRAALGGGLVGAFVGGVALYFLAR